MIHLHIGMHSRQDARRQQEPIMAATASALIFGTVEGPAWCGTPSLRRWTIALVGGCPVVWTSAQIRSLAEPIGQL